MHAEQVTDPVAHHGEGPCWSPGWGGLRWVDMLAGDVLSLTDDGRVTRRHVGDVAAVVRPRRTGGAVVGVERGFAYEAADGSLTTGPELWDASARIRMNEGAVDPSGRFWCGSMAYDQRPGAATLYRLDADRRVETVLTGVTVSNGLDWSPDGSLAYYDDTATHEVAVFDDDGTGRLSGRRVFVDLTDEEGGPDGLCVDAHGGVWVALYGRGQVRGYAPDGRLVEVVEVPARKTTACTFGGPALDQLYVTTSREGLGPGEDPLAGSLFRAEVGVAGQPVRAYAG